MQEKGESLEELKAIKVVRTEFLCVRWSNDDRILAASCSNGLIRTYSCPSFELLKILSHRRASLMPITSLCWFPEMRESKDVLLANTSDGWVMLWQATMGILIRAIQLPGKFASAMEISPNGFLFAVGCSDFSIAVYGTNNFLQEYSLDCAQGNKLGHSNRIFSLKWLDKNTIVSGGWDNTVIIWDVPNQTPLNYIYGSHICGQALDSKHNLMLIGAHARSQQMKIYDLDSKQIVVSQDITQDDNYGIVYGCQFSKHENQNYIALVGSEIQVFSSKTAECLFEMKPKERTYCLDWANSEDVFAIGNSAGKIQIFYIDKGYQPTNFVES